MLLNVRSETAAAAASVPLLVYLPSKPSFPRIRDDDESEGGNGTGSRRRREEKDDIDCDKEMEEEEEDKTPEEEEEEEAMTGRLLLKDFGVG